MEEVITIARNWTPEILEALADEVGAQAIRAAARAIAAERQSLQRRGYTQEQIDQVVRKAAHMIPETIKRFNEIGGV